MSDQEARSTAKPRVVTTVTGVPRELLDRHPTRRISLGLSGGHEMHVTIPGRPGEPVDEATLEALRSIGEAALARMEHPPPASDEAPARCPSGDDTCNRTEAIGWSIGDDGKIVYHYPLPASAETPPGRDPTENEGDRDA